MARDAVAAHRAAGADQTGELPLAGPTVVTQDELPPVVDAHLEIAMRGMQPAVDQFAHLEASRAERERPRLLLAPVPGIAFNGDAHEDIIVPIVVWIRRSLPAQVPQGADGVAVDPAGLTEVKHPPGPGQ